VVESPEAGRPAANERPHHHRDGPPEPQLM
jgi:hypothetical protein